MNKTCNKKYDVLNSIFLKGIKLGSFKSDEENGNKENNKNMQLECKDIKIKIIENGETIDLLNCNDKQLNEFIVKHGINESNENNNVYRIDKDKIEIITSNEWLNKFKEQYQKDENVLLEFLNLTVHFPIGITNDKPILIDNEESPINDSSNKNKRPLEIIDLDADDENTSTNKKQCLDTATTTDNKPQSSTNLKVSQPEPIKLDYLEIKLPRTYKVGNTQTGDNNKTTAEYNKFNLNEKCKIETISSGSRISLVYKLTKQPSQKHQQEEKQEQQTDPKKEIIKEIENEISKLYENKEIDKYIVYICESEGDESSNNEDKILKSIFRVLCQTTDIKVYSSNFRMEESVWDRFGHFSYNQSSDSIERILESIKDLSNNQPINNSIDIGQYSNNQIMPGDIFDNISPYDEEVEKDEDCEGYNRIQYYLQKSFIISKSKLNL